MLIVLLTATLCPAQRSINGILVLKENENKDFILRNTQVMLVTKDRIDSAAIKGDLSFSFSNIQDKSATIYLKSPVLSPKAVTTFKLRKNKPTTLKLNYAVIKYYSENAGNPEYKRRDDDEDFAEVTGAFYVLQAIANIFVVLAIKH